MIPFTKRKFHLRRVLSPSYLEGALPAEPVRDPLVRHLARGRSVRRSVKIHQLIDGVINQKTLFLRARSLSLPPSLTHSIEAAAAELRSGGHRAPNWISEGSRRDLRRCRRSRRPPVSPSAGPPPSSEMCNCLNKVARSGGAGVMHATSAE